MIMEHLSHYFQFGDQETFKAGETIIQTSQKGEADHIYLLASGICALCSMSPNGDELVYEYVQGQRPLSFVPALYRQFQLPPIIRHSFAIHAKTDCVVYRMDLQTFKNLQEDVAFNQLLIYTLTEGNVKMIQKFKRNLDEPISLCFARFLLEVSQPQEQKLVLSPFFKYAEIASYLNTHPVTIAKLVKTLKADRIISKRGQTITLERPQELIKRIEKGESFSY